MSESKVTASHLRRTAAIYVRQSSLAQVERNRESTARQYDLVVTSRNARMAARRGERDRRGPGGVRRIDGGPVGLRGTSHQGRARAGRDRVGVGMLATGPQQRRLVPAAGPGRDDRHADRRRRRRLPSRIVQRPDAARHERAPCPRPNCISCEPASTAASAARPPAASYAAGCRSGWSGAKPTGRSSPTPTKPSAGSSPRSSSSSPCADRCGGCGCGCVTRGLKLPLNKHGYVRRPPRSCGSTRPITRSTPSSPTPPTAAPTPSAEPARSNRSAPTASCGSAAACCPATEWEVCITDHHEGFIDWNTYLDNQTRIGANIRPTVHQPGTGAVREGCALLQGLATCGVCGRKLAVYYDGEHKATPGYYCTGTGQLVDGRGTRHLRIGGVAIDTAVTTVFLTALAPAAAQACLPPPSNSKTATTPPWPSGAAKSKPPATTRPRRTPLPGRRSGKPARRPRPGKAWETALRHLADTETELARRETARPKTLTPQEKTLILTLGADLDGCGTPTPPPTATANSCCAPCSTRSTSPSPRPHRFPCRPGRAVERRRDQRTVGAGKTQATQHLTHRRRHHRPLRRLAAHYPDATIAHILNRQDRRTARGLSYTAGRVQSLRHHYEIAHHQPDDDPQVGELLTVADAAKELGLAALHPAPLARRRLHRRRTTHPRRALADPAHRRHPRPVRRQRPRRLAGHARSHPRLPRVPPDHHATCQARRTQSGPRPHRTPKRPAYPATTHPARTVLTMTINERSSVTIHPRNSRYRTPPHG